jgi:hypothetical protein
MIYLVIGLIGSVLGNLWLLRAKVRLARGEKHALRMLIAERNCRMSDWLILFQYLGANRRALHLGKHRLFDNYDGLNPYVRAEIRKRARRDDVVLDLDVCEESERKLDQLLESTLNAA